MAGKPVISRKEWEAAHERELDPYRQCATLEEALEAGCSDIFPLKDYLSRQVRYSLGGNTYVFLADPQPSRFGGWFCPVVCMEAPLERTDPKGRKWAPQFRLIWNVDEDSELPLGEPDEIREDLFNTFDFEKENALLKGEKWLGKPKRNRRPY